MKDLLIFCDGGFANRLGSLISGIALSRFLGASYSVLWPVNNRCGAAFEELFVCNCPVFQTTLQELVDSEDQLAIWIHENDCGFSQPAVGLRNLSLMAIKDMAMNEPRQVLFAENTILPSLPSNLVAEVVMSLRFTREITKRVLDRFREFGGKPFAGIHLRGTDFGSAPPLDASLELVAKNPQITFFVCSDDPAIEGRFRHFGNTVIHEKTEWVTKLQEGPWRGAFKDSDGLDYTSNIHRSKQSVSEAVVDFLLLSASQPVTTSQSSFLSTAKRFKECNYFERVIAEGQFVAKHEHNSLRKSHSLRDSFQEMRERSPALRGPVPWRALPPVTQAQFTLDGEIPLSHWYVDESFLSEKAPQWDLQQILRGLLRACRKQDMPEIRSYDENSLRHLYCILEKYPVHHKNVLVIGSQRPWIEVSCLAFGAKSVTTVDYNPPNCEYPEIECISVEQFRANKKSYDVVISFSSIEHDGLGRYGDPIDPDADLGCMVEFRGVIRKGGYLFLGVPCGADLLSWNAHRIYGPKRLKLLVNGWSTVDSFPSGGSWESVAQLPLGQYEHVWWVLKLPDLSSQS